MAPDAAAIPRQVCRRCGYELTDPHRRYGPVRCPECGHLGYAVPWRAPRSPWRLLRSCCLLSWLFTTVGVALALAGELSTVAQAIVRVPAVASALMAITLGLVLPMAIANEEYRELPGTSNRRVRSACIVLSGWFLNAAAGAAALFLSSRLGP